MFVSLDFYLNFIRCLFQFGWVECFNMGELIDCFSLVGWLCLMFSMDFLHHLLYVWSMCMHPWWAWIFDIACICNPSWYNLNEVNVSSSAYRMVLWMSYDRSKIQAQSEHTRCHNYQTLCYSWSGTRLKDSSGLMKISTFTDLWVHMHIEK